MSFPRDAYPYTNFHELNLGYFIVHFREIFSQWADLYDQMLNWKDATDEELATWKAGVEADLDQREEALRAELETWKAQTGQDIAGWEDATLAALTAWQTATQAVFEAIRVEAAGSASAAAASAGDAAAAKTAAETAQAAAEAAAASVQASAAQITTNTEDIADLKTQLSTVEVPLVPVATYTDKQARATGLVDVSGSNVVQFRLPKNCPIVHVISYFYGNSRIVFTNYSTPTAFNNAPYKVFPTSGYPTLTDVDEDLTTEHYEYIYVSFTVTEGKKCAASYSALDLINNIANFTVIGNNTSGGITDFNDANINFSYVITSGVSGISNYPPTSHGGFLVTYSPYSNAGLIQLFVSNDAYVYVRVKWGTIWRSWTGIADAATVSSLSDELTALQNNVNNPKIPLELVATYDNMLLRKTGMELNNEFAVYLYKIPDNYSSVHIKTNFYGNVFIAFTDMCENGDFSAQPAQFYPTSGYNNPTTVDDDYNTQGFRYLWVPLYKASGVTASASVPLNGVVWNLENVVNNYDIPLYWDGAVKDGISRIRANELIAGNRIYEFIFVTDTHWVHNAKKSPAIVEYVSDLLHINQVFGGDVVTSTYSDKNKAIAEINAFYDSFKKPLITVLGNHDFNPNSDTTQRLTMPECYALMLRQQEDIKGMDTFASPYWWKLDNDSQKVRVIGFRCDGINTVTADTITAVQGMISELAAGWTVILLTHGFWYQETPEDTPTIAPNVQTVITALLPTIESANASVPLWVVGHSHKDLNYTIEGTTKDILVIGCNCDAYAESAVWGGETMTPGTDTEQAITCIQLDMTSNKVYAVRIGAGSDRTFTLT